MPRKISPTKEIETLLGTPDKTKQVERIQMLVDAAQTPHVAVTVLYDGSVHLAVASNQQIAPESIKGVLQMGIDEVTKQIVLHEQRKQEEEAMSAMAPPDDFGDGEI